MLIFETMAQYVVGSVPYLNARPLVRHFEAEPGPVKVIYDVPSRLPALLEAGSAHAVLASSIEAFRSPGRQVGGGVCISSEGPVRSVRLFSKVPPRQIETLALDQSSLTSNALVQIVLAERFGIRPAARPEPPDLNQMLADHDAGLLIGDAGLRADSKGLHVIDLGKEWTELTSLPFVWALWIGNGALDPELSRLLRKARVESCLGTNPKPGWGGRLHPPKEFDLAIRTRREAVLAAIAQESDWPPDQVRTYLLEVIGFDLGPKERRGLEVFADLAIRHGLVNACFLPEYVVADSELARTL